MIQIDMPMPTNCATCRIQHNIGCNIAKDNGMNTKERDVRCPVKELIQCKDCRWWHESEIYKGFGVCGQANGIAFKPSDWFCADGERRE
jgi:hypothetical protein